MKTCPGRNRAEEVKTLSVTGPDGTQRIRGPPRFQGFAADRANGLCDMIGRLAAAGAYSAHGAGPPGWVPNVSDQSDPRGMKFAIDHLVLFMESNAEFPNKQ